MDGWPYGELPATDEALLVVDDKLGLLEGPVPLDRWAALSVARTEHYYEVAFVRGYVPDGWSLTPRLAMGAVLFATESSGWVWQTTTATFGGAGPLRQRPSRARVPPAIRWKGCGVFYGHDSSTTPPVRHVDLLVSASVDRIETSDGRQQWRVPARVPWVRVLSEDLGEILLHARLKTEVPMRHVTLQVQPALRRAIDDDSPPYSAADYFTFLT